MPLKYFCDAVREKFEAAANVDRMLRPHLGSA